MAHIRDPLLLMLLAKVMISKFHNPRHCIGMKSKYPRNKTMKYVERELFYVPATFKKSYTYVVRFYNYSRVIKMYIYTVRLL